MNDKLYGQITLEYNKNIILPWSDAVKLMELLGQGEFMEDDYGSKPPKFSSMGKEIRLILLTEQIYREMHLNETIGAGV